MATPLLKSWTPNTSYEFKLIIGDEDYSNDIVRISIQSSTLTPYQNVFLELFLDPTDLITNKIYGETKIAFTIILKGDTNQADTMVVMDLMFLKTSTQYSMQRSSEAQTATQKTRQSIIIETVLRNAYKTMNTVVNNIFYNADSETIITTLVNSIQSKPKLEYDTNGKNTLRFDQLLIPPSTLFRTINYLDRIYGIFNGILSVNCFYDNTVRIQNLSKKIQTDQALTIYQLATDIDQSKILESNDPTVFYTKEPVNLINRGNSIISVVSPSTVYIVKPRDQLFRNLSFSTSDVGISYGITDKRREVKWDKEAISENSRKVYRTNQTGYDTDQVFSISDISKKIQDVSVISIGLQHNLPILNLMKVGASVNFIPQVVDYKPIGGMYVLRSSDIGWVRSKVWESWARLNLMRTNITVN